MFVLLHVNSTHFFLECARIEVCCCVDAVNVLPRQYGNVTSLLSLRLYCYVVNNTGRAVVAATVAATAVETVATTTTPFIHRVNVFTSGSLEVGLYWSLNIRCCQNDH